MFKNFRTKYDISSKELSVEGIITLAEYYTYEALQDLRSLIAQKLADDIYVHVKDELLKQAQTGELLNEVRRLIVARLLNENSGEFENKK